MIKFKRPSLIIALIPIMFLIALLSINVIVFSDDASYGPNQIAMMLTVAVVGLLALSLGFDWKTLLAELKRAPGGIGGESIVCCEDLGL